MLFGTALFGLVMGMIIVPIFLTWFGPARLLDEEIQHDGMKGKPSKPMQEVEVEVREVEIPAV